MNINIFFDLFPKTTVKERIALKGYIDALDGVISEKMRIASENPTVDGDDEFYDDLCKSIRAEFDEIFEVGESPAFFMFDQFVFEVLADSGEFWPSLYIGDDEAEPFIREGTQFTIMSANNALTIIKSVFSMHFGGYNGVPFVYDGYNKTPNFAQFSLN